MKTSPQLETSPVKELVRAGHEFAAAMGADTPLIEIAKLVSRLATALDVQLARANTLASLAAEPAGWQVKTHGGNWKSISDSDVDHYRFNEELPVREVYTAHPVPVSVPDALEDDIVSDDHPLLWSYNNGWNACRAAMLLSISQTENGK